MLRSRPQERHHRCGRGHGRAENPEIGITKGTLNPAVGECNDGWLNDIQGRYVTREDVFNALAAADTMTGRDGHSANALPIDIIQPWLKSMPDFKTVKDAK